MRLCGVNGQVMTAAGADGNWLTEDTATQDASAVGNPYLFTGRRWDAETNLYHYRHRDYSPALGRFLQPDPLGYIDGMNLYAYVNNNPLNWIDPWGLCKDSISSWDGPSLGQQIDSFLEEHTPWGRIKDGYRRLSGAVHGTLDATGALEPTPFSDGANAALYTLEGDWKNAGIAAAGMIPYAGDTGKIKKLVSKIGDNPALVRLAKAAGKRVQGSLDNLVKQLSRGNMNPGIGTKHLFNGIFEARARDGARVYFRYVDDTVEIVAKSDKANQQAVIKALSETY